MGKRPSAEVSRQLALAAARALGRRGAAGESKQISITAARSYPPRTGDTRADLARCHADVAPLLSRAQRLAQPLARSFSPEEVAVARHEASHAVVAMFGLCGLVRVVLVTVSQPVCGGAAVREATIGKTTTRFVWYESDDMSPVFPAANSPELRAFAAVAAGGHTGTILAGGATADYQMACAWGRGDLDDADDRVIRDIAERVEGKTPAPWIVTTWRERAMYDARRVLLPWMPIVDKLAMELLRFRVLEAADVARLAADDIEVVARFRDEED